MSSSTFNSILSSLPRRLTDLETFQLPRLVSCKGPLDLHKELVDEMRGDLERVKYNLDLAKEMVYSLPSHEQEDAQSRVHELEQQYLSIKRSFRQGMLDSKRNILSKRSRVHELSEKSNKRYELDESRIGDEDIPKGKGKARSAAEFGMGGDDELQTKTNEVTVALRRTTELMQTELEKSVLSIQTLESSTQTLLSTSSLYDRYTSLLDLSGQLVKAIEKADFLDRIIIFSALGLFFLVVGFIFKRRILDKTVGVVVGGVGRGVGWYLFGTGRLIRYAFKGRPNASGLVDIENGLGSKEIDQLLENGEYINEDSAIGGQSLDSEIGMDLADPPMEGAIPTQVYDASKPPSGKNGKIEIIPDNENNRIQPSWVKDEL
ncbi:uncharacterized protein L199_006346 [Kwoniella botswanensis]|uniref:uncharacterized protein n=1 Tax=Kwoniella botswanensis TaxID=1268659 RepID=UPI00315D436F